MNTTIEDILDVRKSLGDTESIDLLISSISETELGRTIAINTLDCEDNELNFSIQMTPENAISVTIRIDENISTSVKTLRMNDSLGYGSRDIEIVWDERVTGNDYPSLNITIEDLGDITLNEIKRQWGVVKMNDGVPSRIAIDAVDVNLLEMRESMLEDLKTDESLSI